MARPDPDDGGQADDPQLTPALVLAEADALELLTRATLTVEGQLVDASNATLYVAAEHAGVVAAGVYKPISGERPLWDFPDGTLAEREVAAYVVSAASGWDVVPPTVLRDGPFGPGMVQLWIETDERRDARALVRSGAAALHPIAVLDTIINNADRKGGHLLPVPSGHIYGVDHGVCFNVDEKLRTVIWNWAGESLTGDELDVLARLRRAFDADLGTRLAELLTGAEVRRTRSRIERLLRTTVLPVPSASWPSIPWPPF